MRHYTRSEWDQVFDNIVGERIPGAPEQLVTERSATQRFVIGARRQDTLGRVFRYSQIGDGTYGVIAAANVATQVRRAYGVHSAIRAVPVENTVVSVAGVVGGYTISVTSIGTFPINHFQNGFIVNDGAQYGHAARIKSHPASTVAGQSIPLTLYDPLPVVWVLADTVLLFRSKYADVRSPRQHAIEGLATMLYGYSNFVGVPLVDGLAGEFIWAQVKGPAWLVSAAGTDGAAVVERQMMWNVDGSVTPLGTSIGAVQSHQIAGFLIPATQTAAVPPIVGAASPSALDYLDLVCGD